MKNKGQVNIGLLVFGATLMLLAVGFANETEGADANRETMAVELTTTDDVEDVLAELEEILEEIEMEIEGATDLFLPIEKSDDEKQF